MNRQQILAEIRRTAQVNGSKPLGQARFFKQTGFKVSDWFGKYWSRWGDAVREAGFTPNTLQARYDGDELI